MKDKLPAAVFLGFSGGSAGEESGCNVRAWVRSLGCHGLCLMKKFRASPVAQHVKQLQFSPPAMQEIWV